jgi:hypothetical protein
MFSALGLIFGATEGVSSRFKVLSSPGLIFGGTEGVVSCLMYCWSGLVFSGTEGVGSRFHFLRARTHFRRYCGRRVPFLYFCALRLIFGSV